MRTSIVVFVGLFLIGSLTTNSVYAVVAFEGEIDIAADNGFGFANVGMRGSLSGVYLGDRWVLTARHVGAGDITFNGITYHYEEGSDQKITNPTGYDQLDSEYTDLTLYRITEKPDLPSLKIATAAPPSGTELYLAGNSPMREDSLSYWSVNTGTWSWSESETPTQYWGYKTGGNHVVNWGKNQVIASSRGPTDSTCFLALDNCDMVAFKTRFDSQKPREAQAVCGDSGGGAFYFDEEEGWVLAGIISCIEVLPNAPTYALAGSTTCCVDLSFYRDTILDIIASNTTPVVTLPGDANGDGIVDGSDITILANNWQKASNAGILSGDFNGDGIVNGSDVTILANHWQWTASTAATGSSAATQACAVTSQPEGSTEVPEPAMWILLLSIAGFVALRLRKK